MRFILSLLLICFGLSFISPALANPMQTNIPIYVNGQNLNEMAIKQGNTLQVPMRAVANALGYKIIYYPDYENISVEDNIQRAIVHKDSTDVIFQGKLKVINLSRRENLTVPVQIKDNGKAYVEAKFFEAFFNDINLTNDKLNIDTSKVYLDNKIH